LSLVAENPSPIAKKAFLKGVELILTPEIKAIPQRFMRKRLVFD
jgi:hypothetical protein